MILEKIKEITLFIAMLMLMFVNTSCGNGNEPDPIDEDTCPCSDTCLLITDINNPPVITEPTCITFHESITNIPDSLYNSYDLPVKGNITGINGINIKSIEVFAFFNNQITTLCLPNVEYIEMMAFFNNQIIKLELKNIKRIGYRAFERNMLTTLYLPNVEYIYNFAFYYNPDLKEVHIYTDPNLLETGIHIFDYNNIITIYIKNADWKSAMEEKFKDYNVVVKVLS